LENSSSALSFCPVRCRYPKSVSIPVAAIGGINRSNIEKLAGTGVHGVAVVSGVFAAADIEAECRHLRGIADRISA